MTPAFLLQDDDPYVRKTAAVCVAKLFDINPELVEDRGFLDTLKVGSYWTSPGLACLQSCQGWHAPMMLAAGICRHM